MSGISPFLSTCSQWTPSRALSLCLILALYGDLPLSPVPGARGARLWA